MIFLIRPDLQISGAASSLILILQVFETLNFPPFGCSDIITGGLFINDVYFPTTGEKINFQWFADKIIRSTRHEGINYKSITVIPLKTKSVLLKLIIENKSGRERNLQLKLGFVGSVTKAVRTWNDAFPPCERDNKIEIDSKRKALVFKAQHSEAFQIQGMFPLAEKINKYGVTKNIKLKPGELKEIFYVNGVDDNLSHLRKEYDYIINSADKIISDTHKEWNEEIKSAFTPGNSRYSGSIPTLETKDKEISKLYNLGILGLIYFKRDSPYSVIGRTMIL